MTRTIVGWRLPQRERERLLEHFRPLFPDVVADHVTLRYGTGEDTPLPFARSGEIVGEVDDGSGVQALIVRIGGTTGRGDGSHYHLTWSLAAGREAKESNDVLAAMAWRRVHPPETIALEPARWTV
ncbi:hypothetical protein [Sphingopyxis sp. KK2]|uniref:hypothetical protein n=1 Tax=Sphingopyxis sp. KK2 TaxID=1855727 RepID=UPI00097E736F|nr:hypothetical protein [Sphingopyxis sp. KK2]